jgi:hypothetical protein
MNRWIWLIATGIFVVLFGSMLHFLYGWVEDAEADGRGTMVLGAAKDGEESVWGHMTLILFPWLLGSSVEQIVELGTKREIWLSDSLGLTLALWLIPAFFYAYGGQNKSNLVVDITIFIVSIGLGKLLSWYLSTKLPAGKKWITGLGIGLFTVTYIVFISLLYHPPNTKGLFDPFTDDQEDFFTPFG